MEILQIDWDNAKEIFYRKLSMPQYEAYRCDEVLQYKLMKDCICEAAASRRINAIRH